MRWKENSHNILSTINLTINLMMILNVNFCALSLKCLRGQFMVLAL